MIPDQSRVIADAIHLPVNSQSFDVFLADAGRVLVIVNDATRPTPTAKVLDTIFEPLSKTDFRFIIATGVHRGPSEEEFVQIFGKYYPQIKDRIIVHDAKKDEDLVYLGDSTNGTPMYVNKAGVEADRIIIISSVEPHYFAGYTGGRKSFLPGIAGYKTVEKTTSWPWCPRPVPWPFPATRCTRT